jgi:ParB-like chromosome segregation protein Spo0J
MVITKTITIEELGYDEDIVEGCGKHPLKNGEAAPVIVDVKANGKYSLADGYHRLAGMISAGETKITIGILEDSDYIDGEDYEQMVDRLSNK